MKILRPYIQELMSSLIEAFTSVKDTVTISLALTFAVFLFALTRHMFFRMRAVYRRIADSMRRRKKITMRILGPDEYVIDGDRAIVASRQWPDIEW